MSNKAIPRLISGASLIGFAAIALLPWPMLAARLAILFGFGCALAIAFAMRAHEAAHGALIGAAVLAPVITPRLGYMWPLPSVVTLVAYAVVVRRVPSLRASARFATRGKLDRTTAVLGIAFVVLAAIALVIWRFASGADMTVYRQFIPAGVPTWLVFVAIVPYAMLNAIVEEVIWRGALWESCRASFGHAAALVLTSTSFGLAHFHGFPSGVLGIGLATIYGFMMGTIRWRSAGIFWPWIAHVFADVVIFTLVAAMIV
jgi:membrane protease YdiL (CAAX protease family)